MIKRIVIALGFIQLMAGCTINEPSLPDWDTKWKIYLRPEIFTMEEMVDDSVITSVYDAVAGDSVLYISISETTDPEYIRKEDRGFLADDQSFSSTIGIVTLDPPDVVVTDSTMLEELIGDLPDIGQILPPVSAQVLEPEDQPIEFNNFHTVSIDSAMMHIAFYNNLLMEIESGMMIIASDEVFGTVIDTFLFSSSIPPFSMAESEHVSLAGKTISNKMILHYYVPIAGTSEADTVTQEYIDSHYYSEIYISDIKVTAAEAIIPQQVFEESDSSKVNMEGKILKLATLDDGTVINLMITNNLEFSSWVDIRILNLVDDQGNPKLVKVFLEKLSTQHVPVDIGGYVMQHHENPGEEVTHFFYEVISTTVGTADTPDPYRRVTSEDSVAVDFTMDSAYVSYFEGYVDATEIEITPVEKKDLLDASQIEGKLRLNDFVLTLDLYNEINFDIDMNIRLAGYHYNAAGQLTDSVIISLSPTINRGSTGNPVRTRIMLNKDNSTPSIVDLMEILPTDLKLTGNAVIEGEGSARANDRIWAEYSIDSPLKLQIDEPIIYRGEIDSISQADLDSSDRADIDKHFTVITAQLQVMNGLPIGTTVKFFMDTDSTTLFDETVADSAKKIVIIRDIPAGIAGSSGFVEEPKAALIPVELSEQQIGIIKNKNVFYGTVVEIHPNEAPVLFRKRDQLKIEGALDFVVFMNPDSD